MSVSPLHNELVINCKSYQEAQRVSDYLLSRKLAKSIETIDVSNQHWWRLHDGHKRIRLIIAFVPRRRLEVIRTIQVLLPGSRKADHGYSLGNVAHWIKRALESESAKLKR